MHKPINTSMMHDLIVFIFLLIIYFQMKCSHVMINGKITYKGKKILLLFLLKNGYYRWSIVQWIRAIWQFAFQAPSGPPFSGCGRFGASHSHLHHYINRRVGAELPQHSLPLHCAVEKFNHSRSFFTAFSSGPSF
jgi:hypothetical protein